MLQIGWLPVDSPSFGTKYQVRKNILLERTGLVHAALRVRFMVFFFFFLVF